MTLQELILKAQSVPYLEHGNSLAGLDCFGWVELWHSELHGIAIADRQGRDSSPEGFKTGFDAQNDWKALTGPENGAVAVMKSYWNGVVVPEGHCGMVWDGKVYHFEASSGFCSAALDHPRIRNRVTGWYKHRLI